MATALDNSTPRLCPSTIVPTVTQKKAINLCIPIVEPTKSEKAAEKSDKSLLHVCWNERAAADSYWLKDSIIMVYRQSGCRRERKLTQAWNKGSIETWRGMFTLLAVLSLLESDAILCVGAFHTQSQLSVTANHCFRRHGRGVLFPDSFDPPSTPQRITLNSLKDHSASPPEEFHQSTSKNIPESVRRRRLLISLLAAATGPSATVTATTMPVTDADDTNLLDDASSTTMATVDWSTIEVMKPPLDDRNYELMVLPSNGLRVVLCSDPSSNEAGAAMDVHVGACSDPVEVPGLAHFNEHMLFLGTKEYPKEDSFEEFLSANGGSSNAYVSVLLCTV